MYTTDELGLGNPIEEVIEKVIKSRADGVVLFNNNCIDKEIDLIKKYRIPAVVVGYKISDEDICSVYVDAKSIAYDMTKQFIEQGKKNMTYYTTPYGTIEMGIAATNLNLEENDSGLNMKVDYALDMNQEHVADCYLAIKAQPKNCKDFTI